MSHACIVWLLAFFLLVNNVREPKKKKFCLSAATKFASNTMFDFAHS